MKFRAEQKNILAVDREAIGIVTDDLGLAETLPCWILAARGASAMPVEVRQESRYTVHSSRKAEIPGTCVPLQKPL
jgi:hypothetical protein